MTVPARHAEPPQSAPQPSAPPADPTTPPTAQANSAPEPPAPPADPTPPLTVQPATSAAPGPVFWVCAAVGVTMIVFGVHAVLRTRSTPIYWVGRWMLGLLVVHDGVITVAVGVAGWALTRWLPDWLSGPVRGALALTMIVVVFSLPLWQRRGIDPSNPSRLPLNYATAVFTVVAAVWICAAVVAASRWRTRRRLR